MNWQDYVKLAKRTESVPIIIYSTIPGPNDNFDMSEELEMRNNEMRRATRLMHAVVGLVTETQELVESDSDRNTAEELGDCFWYLAIAFDELEMLLPLYGTQFTGKYYVDGMQHHAAELVDSVIKRHIFYGKPLDIGKVKLLLESYTTCLMSYALACNQYSLSEILEANIKKLEKRYPDLRFNGDHAINRDVENELSHITEPPVCTTPSYEELWEELKKGTIFSYSWADEMGLSFEASPHIIEAVVLSFLKVESKDEALQLLGDELRYCQFTVVHKEEGIEVKAIPFNLDKPGTMTTEEFNHEYLQTPKAPVHPDEELSIKLKEDAENYFTAMHSSESFKQHLSKYGSVVLEKLAMDIASLTATHFRELGAGELAQGFYSVYRTFSGKGNRLEDNSLYEMYRILYPAHSSNLEMMQWLNKLLGR